MAGSTDQPPDWGMTVMIHRVLWEHYGIPWSDMDADDLVKTMVLEGAIASRRK